MYDWAGTDNVHVQVDTITHVSSYTCAKYLAIPIPRSEWYYNAAKQ